MKEKKLSTQSVFSLLLLTAALVMNTGLEAGAINELQAPLKGIKSEIWSYMNIVKIAAVVVGGCFSVMKQSVTPLGIGAGITAGIAFFDKIIGDGSAALITNLLP